MRKFRCKKKKRKRKKEVIPRVTEKEEREREFKKVPTAVEKLLIMMKVPEKKTGCAACLQTRSPHFVLLLLHQL